MHRSFRWRSLFLFLAVVSPAMAAEPLVVYSGRSKSLVEPLIQRFEAETGIDVQVRFGRDAEILATLAEEGSASPADVVWFNTAGALGMANNRDLLAPLPSELLSRPSAFTPSSGKWVPLSTRFRVLAFNSRNVKESDLPASVLDLPKLQQYKGRIGWTPTYSSFQDFVTALRLAQGEDVAKQWLAGMQALDPKAYTSNTPMIQALAAGEIDVAITNHYYVLRMQQGSRGQAPADAAVPVKIHTFQPGDVGNLALVTGGGVLQQSDNHDAAHRFLAFLLNPESQRFAPENVHEYPVVTGIELPDYMLPMDRVLELSPDFDFERLRELDATLQLLREAGLL